MRPVKLLSIALMLTGICFLGKATAQIKIGTNGAIIAPASLLELESANQGLLLPRLTDTLQINALIPPDGMLVYITKNPNSGLYIRKGGVWVPVQLPATNANLTGVVTSLGNVTAIANGVITNSMLANAAVASLTGTNTGDQTATTVANVAAGTIAAVTVQGALNELDTEKAPLASPTFSGTVTAPTFVGTLTGNATTATSTNTATNSLNSAITDDNSNAGTFFPVFVGTASGNQPIKSSSTNLKYVPSTGILKAKEFEGNFTGNVSGTATNITGIVLGANGGTGKNNTGKSITLGGNLETAGAFNTTLTSIAPTNVILPTSGTLATLDGAETLTNKTLTAPILGVAGATSVNKVVITAPANSATLTIADGKTLSVSNDATVSGTNTGDQTTITGNAATATTLITARTIGGVSFNGSANIDLPGVNTAGNQNTTGNAANVTGVVLGVNGGTGVANAGKTITLGGNLATAGAFATTLTSIAPTNVTLPTSGTLATLDGTETFTNKTLTSPNVIRPVVSSILVDGSFISTKGLTGTNVDAESAVLGTNLAGTVKIVISGGSGSANERLIEVLYSESFTGGSYPILYPANKHAAELSGFTQVFVKGFTNKFEITSSSIGLPVNTYIWNYQVVGKIAP
jgi:hypothetical protein